MQLTRSETLHQVLELCLPKLNCASLAALASSSKDLHAAVQALVRSSTAGYLLCKSVRDAALCDKQHLIKHTQAVKWLCELGGSAAQWADILQGSTAAALLATPCAPEEVAAVLAAAGLRFTFQQVVEACARPVAGAWVWIKAGAVQDAPALAPLLLLDDWRVSAVLGTLKANVCQQCQLLLSLCCSMPGNKVKLHSWPAVQSLCTCSVAPQLSTADAVALLQEAAKAAPASTAPSAKRQPPMLPWSAPCARCQLCSSLTQRPWVV